ncbi:MAG: DUF488 domain-containing protein [Chloroflexi bacterium]|nr:DUF488 domain-containing protein [Chloroflexota bacterium]
MLQIRRVYEPSQPEDGTRILVDRLWPRGIRSEDASIKEWLKDLAPSDVLRRSFGHDPQKWPEFRRRYLEELCGSDKTPLLQRIAEMAARDNVTLVYGARDTDHNNALVLQELIDELMVRPNRRSR